MYLWRQAQHDPTRERLVGFLPQLLAGRQVVVDGLVKGRLQFSHRGPVETDDVSHTREVADEQAVFGVELNAGAVALVSHAAHGIAPIEIKKSRASRTRYRKASLRGWGRWKYARRPSFSKVTEEPLPSVTVHPAATNMASIRRHSSVPFNGSANTANSVLRCVLFTNE